ncbi:MAG: aminotransferase class III-fold pyridoxal phosphate-dependent enzyme, partial [Thiotrichales bacterium]|nr:aminotransferase class III-fold pyridoxal phosphate-dependent enzyme [Thiotrichales bacterium]
MTTTAEAARPPSIGRHGRFTDMERNNLAEAESLLPGGVMGSTRLPDDIALVFSHGRGARFRDTSGNEYIDYCLGSGPLILGHAHEAVVRAITEQAARGT